MRIRAAVLTAVGLSLTLTLTGCMGGGMWNGGGQPRPSASATAAFAQADVHFNMMMIPHHQQAIEMADVILAADGISSDVTDLATRIKAAQAPEIDQMSAWLEARGYPSDDASMGPGHGMMSDDDLDQLRGLDGVEAERLFLAQMIEHHQGAIEMANDEISAGLDAETIALCQSIVLSQTAEITEMQELLADR